MDYRLVNGKFPCFGSFEDNRNLLLVCLCLLVLKCHILKKLDSSWLGNGWMQQRCILFYRAFRATTDLPKKCICHCTNREAMGRYQGKRREWKLGNVNYSLRVLLSFCYENRRCSRSPFLNFGNCCVSSTLDGWGEWWHFSENCNTATVGHSQRVFVTQSPCFVTQDVFLQRKRKSSIRFSPTGNSIRSLGHGGKLPEFQFSLRFFWPKILTFSPPIFLYPLKILSFFPSCFYPSKINFSSFFWHFHSKSPLSYHFLLKPYLVFVILSSPNYF